MKLDFGRRNMDIATFSFRFMRILALAGTGGSEVNECYLVLEKAKKNNDQSWIKEWATMAGKLERAAEQSIKAGQAFNARQQYLRASSYYQVAMFSLSPADERLFTYLAKSRELFHKASKLFSPQIEIVDIPFGDARLPAYFMSGGEGKRPTLLVINGGDSTNEEMIHFIGFAATQRGWNCVVFEGPGQWSALQLNPGLVMTVDYEKPVKAVVDYLLLRNDIDPEKIVLYGLSLSSLLAARAVAYEKRISACILNGGPVVDVNEAWEAVRPPFVKKTIPGVWDFLFGIVMKFSAQFAGLVNHFMWSFGVSSLREVLEAFVPFNIRGLAPMIHCPTLILEGEAEYAQTDRKTALSAIRFISELTCSTTIHEFGIDKDGWAASHCQIGGVSAASVVIFDWLDKTLINKDRVTTYVRQDWSMIKKYHDCEELDKIVKNMPANIVSNNIE
jgi:pimeloyl-ACP methyl ester carboxylesterase